MRVAVFTTLAIFIAGCASFISKSTYPIQIGVNPPGAEVTIIRHLKNEDKIVYQGQAPCVVVLPASDGYFKRALYTINLSAPGRLSKKVPLTFKVDGWYWGNIFLGGLVGWLIVDPATGAMYAPHTKRVLESLSKTDPKAQTPRLQIKTLQEIDPAMMPDLIVLEAL